MFPCEFCEISKNTFFTEHTRKTASEKRHSLFLDSRTTLYRISSEAVTSDLIAGLRPATLLKNPANIRLGEDVLKTWRRLGRRFEDVLKTSSGRFRETSWRCFRKTYCKYVLKTSSKRLGRRKVLRWRRLQDVLKTSWKTRNLYWEETLAQVFSCEFCEIPFFIEHLWWLILYHFLHVICFSYERLLAEE